MSLLESILHLLADGKFHSDKEISQFLGIPSNVVAEVLKQLLDPSINLEIVNHCNYRILDGLELLDASFLHNELGNIKQLLTKLEVFPTIVSTNTYLLEKKELIGNYAVFAEHQTAGRGQFNRQWISRFGKNIYLSLLWHFPNCFKNHTGLTLITGIAVVRALKDYGLQNIQLKWPNDIVYQQKKLGGILIETRFQKESIDTAVIGIGLNLYNPLSPGQAIDQAITDICSLQKLPPQRNRLAALILKNLLKALLEFQIKGFAHFVKEWQSHDSLIGKPISIKTEACYLEGIAQGINLQGQLQVVIKKKMHCFNNGEIRVILKT